eukprot:m.31064 g.31064  ORF g.31064 m.31064 type:complete len:467 (+) comp31432_c0_seq1:111-1511(+)
MEPGSDNEDTSVAEPELSRMVCTRSGKNPVAYDVKSRRKRRPDPANPDSFRCDQCGSDSILKHPGSRPGGRNRRVSTRKPVPRYKTDPATGKELCLCNACGLAFDRQKPKKELLDVEISTEEERMGWMKDAEKFGQSLALLLNDINAAKLYCSKVKSKPCWCVQRYLTEADGIDKQRALDLLNVLQKAAQLSSQKRQSFADKDLFKLGRKRSLSYEEFVEGERKRLKEDCNICEITIKKFLGYSNNFLYKKLKTSRGESRIEVKQKKRDLISFDEFAGLECCEKKCTRMNASQREEAEQWRERYGRGRQIEGRQVVSEMLRATTLDKPLCTQFIQLVTGCSAVLVKDIQMGRGIRQKRVGKATNAEEMEQEEDEDVEEEAPMPSKQKQSQTASSIHLALTHFLSDEPTSPEQHPLARGDVVFSPDKESSDPASQSIYLGAGAMPAFAAEAAMTLRGSHDHQWGFTQ